MHDPTAWHDDGSALARWNRRFRAGAILVLALAAVNLFVRLDREAVTEWDEALYATSAAETVRHGNWIGTTLDGTLDYYNTKPPLNIWLIAGSFKTFGIGLFSLRIASAAAAWSTVLVLLLWGRRAFGAATALFAGLVLSATYGFIHVHSGRTANTDALFTLLVLLIVVSLWTGRARPWRLTWLGPILAAAFLVRGMAVLMPLILVATVLVIGGRQAGQRRWRPLATAAVLGAAPVAAWGWARWRLDGMQFLGPMFHYDFVARSATALEGHTGSLLYYPNNLQKDHYAWLVAAVVALLLLPLSRERFRRMWPELPGNPYAQAIAGAWLGVTVLIPTLMQTKVAWYLNPFYPLFALLVGRTFAQGFVWLSASDAAVRRRVLAGAVGLALAVAEGRVCYYSFTKRDLSHTVQGLLLAEGENLAGKRVFQDTWTRADRFVLQHVVGGHALEAAGIDGFVRSAGRGDYVIVPRPDGHGPDLVEVRANRRHLLCRRRE